MDKVLKKEVRDYYYGEDEYFDEAFDNVMKTAQTYRIEVEHTLDIDNDDLFDGIDNVIAFLNKLKSQGYIRIEERWSGYEDNYFVAIKKEPENDEEYYRRLAVLTNVASEVIGRRESEKAKKNKRIMELEAELKRLRKL